MNTHFSTRTIVLGLLCSGAILFHGCQKASETPANKTENPAPAVQQTPAPAPVAADTAKKPEVKAADLKGTWTGTLEGFKATLTVNEQKDKNFTGDISVRYREAAEKKLTGEYNAEKGTVTMMDISASRVKGTYHGELSADGKTIKGTFTYAEKKNTVTFTLTKK